MMFVVPALVATLALSACSGSDDTDTSSTTVVEEAPATTGLGSGDTVPAGDLPEGADTTLAVRVPEIEPQEAAGSVRPGAEAAAERFNSCAAEGSCREVDLVLVSWPGAQLPGIDFGFAEATGADLRGADLSGADFTGANLSGANLTGAKLDGATLASANLSGATLVGASVQGVDLSGTNLFEAIIDGASFRSSIFCQTTWIDGRELNNLC
jgi:uncharacterized protein YjbI with pentapeptide repeats